MSATVLAPLASKRPTSSWRLSVSSPQQRREVIPRTLPATTIPPMRGATDLLAAPQLRLAPPDPLNRRSEDLLTKHGWKPHPPQAPLPHPYPWAHAMARVIFEVLEGLRSCEQLARWLAPDLYQALRERQRLNATSRQHRQPLRISTRSIRLQVVRSRLGCTVIECIGVVDVGQRSRAVSLRAESYHSRWRITALEVG